MLYKSPKKTVREELVLVNAILKCTIGKNVTPSMAWLFIDKESYVFEGRVLERQPNDPIEQVKAKMLDDFLMSIIQNIFLIKLCRLSKEVVFVNDCAPLLVDYMRLTKFGRFYLKSPIFFQFFMYVFPVSVINFVKIIIKYRWFSTLCSVLFGVVTWFHTHEITNYTVILAGIIGLAAAVIISWVSSQLNG